LGIALLATITDKELLAIIELNKISMVGLATIFEIRLMNKGAAYCIFRKASRKHKY
jgi:hypothetical protein